MAIAFEPGWVVELTCGGPDMTVAKVDGDKVTCIWFPLVENHFSQTPVTFVFDAACLTISKKWLEDDEEEPETSGDEN